eukprot:jgi/Mesvir1/3925/Mv19865-RA.1
MFFNVGGEGGRPTFFELVAAERLMPSLKAALYYSLGVMAARYPLLHRVLDHSEESFALLMLALEWNSVANNDASFAESLYGLARASTAPTHVPTPVGVPYLREKLKQVYELYGSSSSGSREALLLHLDAARPSGEGRGAGADDLMWDAGMPAIGGGQDPWATRVVEREDGGDASGGGGGDAAVADGGDGVVPRGAVSGGPHMWPLQAWRDGTWRPMLRRWARAALCQLHLLVHTSFEGANFLYQLLYLLGETPYFSLSHHLLQLSVVRASAAELAAKGNKKATAKGAALARVRGPYVLQLLKRAWVHLRYSGADFALSSLVVSIFAFKVLEWWYMTAESRIFVPQRLPPPPPPPAPKPARGGVPLPSSSQLCPLCGGERTNPALVAVSGYAFCYRCIFRYIQQYGRCPVTLMPATEDDVRRLYIDT